MKKYIALLRGVNVGGKNKISMSELKSTFEEYGFLDVKTYINSGNIIFSSNTKNEEDLKIECEHAITDRFQADIPVAIISAINLSKALENAPTWWDSDKESKHNAIFLIPPITAEMAMTQVGPIKQEYEQVGSYGKVIFWSAPIKTFSKTRWSNIAKTSVYQYVTIRNSNTAKKLLLLTK